MLGAEKARFQRVFCLVLGAFFLASCGTVGPFVEVTRFHTIQEVRGERVLIEPAEGNEGGLEFQRYAEELAAYLVNYGYTPTESRTPQLIARFGFSAEPDPGYYAASGPMIGIGFGGAGRHVGGGIATSVDLSDDNEVYYRHTITLTLENPISGERVFEGSAEGFTRGEYWPTMMPRLLQALFTDWPGQSGETKKIKFQD